MLNFFKIDNDYKSLIVKVEQNRPLHNEVILTCKVPFLVQSAIKSVQFPHCIAPLACALKVLTACYVYTYTRQARSCHSSSNFAVCC